MECRRLRAVCKPMFWSLAFIAAALVVGAPCQAQDDFAQAIKDFRLQKTRLRQQIGTALWRDGRFEKNAQRSKVTEY